jgi:TfoX/Sxy family transcriptional regulator of competence genes
MSLREATKESLYLQNVIRELFINNSSLKDYALFSNKLNTIKTDSLSAIELAKNPVYYAKTKHVNITYYFVRENLLSNKIDLVYEDTNVLLADNLTKATSIPKLKDFTRRISLVELE